MKLTEYKTARQHYFFDEDDKMHGLYQCWRDNGEICVQRQYNHGQWHGENKFFYEDGSLMRHDWFEHDKRVLDFLAVDEYPTDEDERLIHRLTHQGGFIPK